MRVSGNLKFEVKPTLRPAIAEQFEAVVDRYAIGPVLIAGSTLEGEETMLLEMFRTVLAHYSFAALVLAPRHPERFGVVASLLAESGLRWRRRSEWNGEESMAGRVLVLDSIGELASLYEFADLAFVGGSLVPRGGHNVLEAARFGVPILVGRTPRTFATSLKFFGGTRLCGWSRPRLSLPA